MSHPVRIVVGLGNPGPRYAATRHNAGRWFVEGLGERLGVGLRAEPRLGAQLGWGSLAGTRVALAVPEAWMNESGRPVRALLDYYRLPREALLVAHDDLDLPPGVARLKHGGGHGGHNGLRDLIAHLGDGSFGRLRLGIGHPGERDAVTPWVLSPPSAAEREAIEGAIARALEVVEPLVRGDWAAAQRVLHAREARAVVRGNGPTPGDAADGA
ncbi:MAG: aminoacyl-tRNA hydrolase [Xanthomonadales bacterium]|nr:aminoacyl-tRNA hydrolase [Xanthomonadales bacterium]